MSGVSREEGMAANMTCGLCLKTMVGSRVSCNGCHVRFHADCIAKHRCLLQKAEAAGEDSGTPGEKPMRNDFFALRMARARERQRHNAREAEDSGTAPMPRTCDACGAEVREVSADLYRCVSCATCYTLEGFLKLGAVGAVPEKGSRTFQDWWRENWMELQTMDPVVRLRAAWDAALAAPSVESAPKLYPTTNEVKFTVSSVESAATADAFFDYDWIAKARHIKETKGYLERAAELEKICKQYAAAERRASVPGEKEPK